MKENMYANVEMSVATWRKDNESHGDIWPFVAGVAQHTVVGEDEARR